MMEKESELSEETKRWGEGKEEEEESGKRGRDVNGGRASI